MDIIKPSDPTFIVVPRHIQKNPLYMPHFQDCIDAIDGTHIQVVVREGKYYLVDVGYPLGQRYHLLYFRQAGRGNHLEGRFKYVHSSLRSVIEKTFGVWKNRWKILKQMPSYDIKHQRNIMGDLIGMSMTWINQEAIVVEKVVADRQTLRKYKMRK
ncbi:hypothetical protein SO802_030948 [Lithocarpus litseifolius]|uniref:DDE Tnp4 domain-containing protein n=1 Tax=Lithocarpus litseifolius TaxID=425828 RepID=A0AAW2BLH1_9ROSI